MVLISEDTHIIHVVVAVKFGLRNDEFGRLKKVLLNFLDPTFYAIGMEDADQGPQSNHMDAIIQYKGKRKRFDGIRRTLYNQTWECVENSPYGFFEPNTPRPECERRLPYCIKVTQAVSEDDAKYVIGYNTKENAHFTKAKGCTVVKYATKNGWPKYEYTFPAKLMYECMLHYRTTPKTESKKRKRKQAIVLNRANWDMLLYDYCQTHKLTKSVDGLNKIIMDDNYWLTFLPSELRLRIVDARLSGRPFDILSCSKFMFDFMGQQF